jgi:hypothetical protein
VVDGSFRQPPRALAVLAVLRGHAPVRPPAGVRSSGAGVVRAPVQVKTSVLPPMEPLSTNSAIVLAIFAPPRADGSIGLA